MTFSIIVLNWNGKKWLDQCFKSIQEQNYPDLEVIMTDNGSDDGSAEYVKERYLFVKVLENGSNLGYTGANNNAAKIAGGEYLIFLNNDTWLESEFLSNLAFFINQTKSKIIQPLILPYNEMNRSKHVPFTGLDRFGYPAVSHHPFYVDGCCLIILSELFKKLGGFDDRYFIFMEDLDLSWRARIVGEDIGHNLECVVHHECGGSVIGSMPKGGKHQTSYKRRYLSEKNIISNVIKNYEAKNLIWVLPICLSLSFGEALIYLLHGEFRAMTAILKAMLWNLTNIRSTLVKRKEIQTIRTTPDSMIFPKMIKGVAKWRAFRDIGGVPKFS